MEVSAKVGTNIETSILLMCQQILEKQNVFTQGEITLSHGSPPQREGWCC